MKKLVLTGLLLTLTVSMIGCSYDDSEDIDILIPDDNPKTTSSVARKPVLKS